jgi:ribonuclease BN (tRNA processing enzyme)
VKDLKLTILGNNGPYPAAGGACSGYLLREGGKSILIDCGNGVLGNLQKVISLTEIDAIILTHLHSDHMSDMMVLRYAVDIMRKRGLLDKGLTVYAPPEPVDEFQRLDIKNVFLLTSISQELEVNLGAIKLTFAKMKHPFMDYAVSAECNGKRFVFSGDTSWTDEIINFGKNADLLMLDAGFLDRDLTENPPHLSARQCGLIARESGAKRLLLTHFWPGYQIDQLVSEASEVFENVEQTKLLKDYEI